MADRRSIQITVVGATDVGRVREHNEDNFLVADLTAGKRAAGGEPVSGELGERGVLLAVADGMGGAASGEIASETAVQILHDSFATRKVEEGGATPEEISRTLDASLRKANEEIYGRGQKESEHRGMGTTMTAALSLGDTVYLAQVGDSRAYLLRKGKLVQVTKDQSLISQLIEDGTLTEEEAEKLGGKNIILQALGVEPDVKVDCKHMEVLNGDTLLLCSDGLTGMVADADIRQVMAEEQDLAAAAETLIRKANEGGGRDNITVVLARFEGPGLREPLETDERAMEEGGVGEFIAPEVPEVKRSLVKPLIVCGVGVVALVVLILLLSGGTADVTFTFPAVGGSLRLIPAEEGAETIEARAPDSTEVLVEGVPPGAYTLEADLAHHEPLRGKPIVLGAGSHPFAVPIRPKDGKLQFVPGTPNVRVAIAQAASGWQREVPISGRREKEVPDVPAGHLALTVTREGFEPASLEVDLPPEGSLSVDLPALEPILAPLSVTSLPGARVTVVDEYGDPVYEGEIPGTGTLSAKVRIGENYTLEIAKEGFQAQFVSALAVPAEQGATVSRSLTPKEASFTVKGPPGQRFELVNLETGWNSIGNIREETGNYEWPAVKPGTYLLKTRKDGREWAREYTVRPGEPVVVEFEQ